MSDYRPFVFRLKVLSSLQKYEARKCLNKHGLHLGQPFLLQQILENPGITQYELAMKLNVTPASIATSTKRMEKLGYLLKNEDQNNLRCKRLYITELGRKLTIDSRKDLENLDKLMFKNISNEELEILANIYDKLIINITGKEELKTPLSKEDLIEICNSLNKKEEEENV